MRRDDRTWINQYTIGAAIFLIVLSAIYGISQAFSWLSQAPQQANNPNTQVITSGNDTLNSNGLAQRQNPPSALSQNNRALNGQTERSGGDDIAALRQVNRGTEIAPDGTFALSPLEEAGTYIQRQQRVARDATIAQTDVEVSATSSTPVASQGNTRVEQPDPARTATDDTTRPSAQRSNSTQTEAVPALW